MASHGIDGWLKRIWLVNGLVLLALIGASAIALAAGGLAWLSGSRHGEGIAARPAAGAPSGGAPVSAAAAVRLELPERVVGTTASLVVIREAGEGTSGAIIKSSYDRSQGDMVNVAVLGPSSGAARLVFDRPVLITALDYPSIASDSLRRWIAYDVVEQDADRDGRLEAEDGATLYLSDLDGARLRRVLPAGWRLREHAPTPDGKAIVIFATRAPAAGAGSDDARAERRAFLHDLAGGQTRPWTELDSLAARAASLTPATP